MKNKKHLNIFLILYTVIFILSFIIPGMIIDSNTLKVLDVKTYLSIESLIKAPYNLINLFGHDLVLLISVIVFYSLLKSSKYYSDLIKRIASKFNSKRSFTFFTFLILFILTSFFNLGFSIIIFIPFILDIYKTLNIKKELSAGVILYSTLTGYLTSFTAYSNYDYINSSLGRSTSLPLSFKILLLIVLSINLFIYISYKFKGEKNILIKYNKNKSFKETSFNIILIILLITILFISFSWGKALNITTFDKFISNLGYKNSGNNFFGNLNTFGNLNSLDYSFLLLISSIIICFFKDSNINKKLGSEINIKIITSFILVHLLVILSSSTNFLLFIINKIVVSLKHLPILSSVITSIISFLFVPSGLFSTYSFLGALDINLSLKYLNYIWLFTNTLMMIILPTSLLLLLVLNYNKVSIKNYYKDNKYLLLLTTFIVFIFLFILKFL